MAAPYSQDLREKVLAACDRGMTTKHIAEVFGVCRSWVRRVKQRRREHGETTPRKQGSPGVCKIDREHLARLVAERPDATAAELRERLGIECSEQGIYAALKALNLTFKKRRSMRPSKTAPTSPASDARGVGSSLASTRGD